MKAKTLYYCEMCGTPYSAEKEALECERYHKNPRKIVRKNLNYKPKGVGPAWPFRIRVEDDKGNSCQYVYDGKEKSCMD